LSLEPSAEPSAKLFIELSKEPSLSREPSIGSFAKPKSSIEPELASVSDSNLALELALPGSYWLSVSSDNKSLVGECYKQAPGIELSELSELEE
jgi:hypothetical protein